MIKLPTTYINGEHWNDQLETEIRDTPAKLDFKLDATGNAVLAYCSECNKSDFYDPFKVHNMDSNCCNYKLVPEKPNTPNGTVSVSDIMEKYQ